MKVGGFVWVMSNNWITTTKNTATWLTSLKIHHWNRHHQQRKFLHEIPMIIWSYILCERKFLADWTTTWKFPKYEMQKVSFRTRWESRVEFIDLRSSIACGTETEYASCGIRLHEHMNCGEDSHESLMENHRGCINYIFYINTNSICWCFTVTSQSCFAFSLPPQHTTWTHLLIARIKISYHVE